MDVMAVRYGAGVSAEVEALALLGDGAPPEVALAGADLGQSPAESPLAAGWRRPHRSGRWPAHVVEMRRPPERLQRPR
jgi:hypothetical protein